MKEIKLFKNQPVPIEAIMASIAKILAENIGNRFQLEIDEKDVENYRGEKVHEIEMILTVQEERPKKNVGNTEGAPSNVSSLPKEHLKNSEIPF